MFEGEDLMAGFEAEYVKWLSMHKANASGERLRRLVKGHGFGEKLLLQQCLWPVLGSLDDLHPEYEFIDSEGNYYYMDYAYLRRPKPTCLEADGFSTHARDADRDTFSRGLDRQNEIVLSDWNILRFSIDKLKEDPKSCQRKVEKMLIEWYGETPGQLVTLSLYQREIVRLCTASATAITPAMVSACLGKSDRFVRDQLHLLMKMGVLEPSTGEQRIRSYRLRAR
jgi:hypothetical protein